MPKAKVNGVEIYYELAGSGDYLLQVPGAVSGHLGYADITPGMAKHFIVIDYDPRGYGLSDRPKQKYTFEIWARDMVGLLDALGVERAHVHGGSMGSSLAVYFAANHPDRINGTRRVKLEHHPRQGMLCRTSDHLSAMREVEDAPMATAIPDGPIRHV